MRSLQFLFLISIVLWGSPKAQAYEDTHFEFHGVVSDSVLLVLRGVEYIEFDLENFPGDQELYLNGVPVFKTYIAVDGDDKWDFFKEIKTALGYLKSGLSCSQSYLRYENDKNVLVWDLGDWLNEPEQSQKSDFWLTLKLFLICHSSEIAPDIKGMFVWNGAAYIHFAGVRYSGSSVRKIPSVKERSNLGGRIMPFREQALAYSRSLLRQVQKEHRRTSTIHAISHGGGIMSKGGRGIVAKGRQQLKLIQEKGEYVDGPIPKSHF